jgi:hypothetical protein
MNQRKEQMKQQIQQEVSVEFGIEHVSLANRLKWSRPADLQLAVANAQQLINKINENASRLYLVPSALLAEL